MTRRLLALLLAVLLLWLPLGLSAQEASTSALTSELAQADKLFFAGRLDEAATKYQAIANADPKAVAAQVGLIRIYLIQQKLDQAQATMKAALAAEPNSALLMLTEGDVDFRLGKLPDAERAYVKAQNLVPKEPAPYLGLARVYRAYSLYRRAYDEVQRAHEIAPGDVAVQLMWADVLPAADKQSAIKAFIAGPGAPYPSVVGMLQQVLEFLKQSADTPPHACTLAGKVQQTNTKLYSIARAGMQLGASGLNVKLNNQELHLAVDTGASGILIGRNSAEQAGLKRLAYQRIGGFGDTGQQGGYTAIADHIRIGDLEFQNCVVRVTDSVSPVTGQDGLIGTDVFSSYLIDLDIPGGKLKLSPLPTRPNETAAPVALHTLSPETSNPGNEAASNAQITATSATDLPKDAYVAPDMQNWTKVYRFKHLLLVPTKVDHTGPMLFVLDTGSFSNVLSTTAARTVTQVTADNSTQIRGLSGTVGQVYRADKATLEFGRYEQQNQDVITMNLLNMCKVTGTEVSGILGFAMLRILQVQIDYRDGLVNFIYDPHHLPKGMHINK